MSRRIEWRSRAEGDDNLLVIDDGTNTVITARAVDPHLLVDFLNDMEDDSSPTGDSATPSHAPDPANWGELVLARAETGEVLGLDPELYWDGMSWWFRSRGNDPHPWRGR